MQKGKEIKNKTSNYSLWKFLLTKKSKPLFLSDQTPDEKGKFNFMAILGDQTQDKKSAEQNTDS